MSKGRKPALTAEQVEYAAAEYKRGRTMPNIADELNVSAATIRTYFIDADVPRRRAGCTPLISDELVDLAAEMRAEGVAWKLISRKLGMAHSTLERAIRKRSREEALMPAKKFNKKQTTYIVEQYQRGRSGHCIAREMGVTMQTILVYLEEQKVVRRVAGARKMVTKEIAETAVKLRAEGNKWAYIEKVVGVSRETLRQALIRMKEGEEV